MKCKSDLYVTNFYLNYQKWGNILKLLINWYTNKKRSFLKIEDARKRWKACGNRDNAIWKRGIKEW
jgi:hypothetical protein